MHTRIYALGSNGCGQLGINSTEDVNVPHELPIPSCLTDSHIKQIASGGNHTIFLTDSGEAYVAGANDDGRCGTTQQSDDILRPRRIALCDIKLCAATWSASIFVTNEDRLYSCGSGPTGELGQGSENPLSSTVVEVSLPHKTQGQSIIQISASLGHVMVVFSSGLVCGWGNGRNGQLGEPADLAWTPRLIEEVPFCVARVACGKDFTCFASQDGDLFILGLSKRDRFRLKATVPRALPGWKALTASWGGVFVLGSDGTLHSYGRNDRGQLGVEGLTGFTTVAPGSEHVLALLNTRKVATWGWGEHGNCGTPVDGAQNVQGRCNTLDVPGVVQMVHAGCATSFIVVEGD